MKDFPKWVLKYKKKGVELRKIRGLYYMYEVSSSWDKELKRPKKKTGVYLGRITEEKGFIAKKSSEIHLEKDSNSVKIHVKERGVSEFIKIVWIRFFAFIIYNVLNVVFYRILKNVGTEYRINFSLSI